MTRSLEPAKEMGPAAPCSQGLGGAGGWAEQGQVLEQIVPGLQFFSQ